MDRSGTPDLDHDRGDDEARRDRDRLFALSLDLMCVTGFDGRFRQINPAWTRLTGWEACDLVGAHYARFVHPDDREATGHVTCALLQGSQAQGFENRFRTRDGGYRWLSWSALPDVDEGKIFCVVRDVTDHRQLRERLDASLCALEEAQRVAGIGSWEWDIGDDVVTWSTQLHQIFGTDPAVPPPTYSQRPDYLDRAGWPVLHAGVTRALSHGEPYDVDLQFVRPDGTTGWISCKGEAVRDAEGRIVKLRGTAQDITHRYVAEALRRERDAFEAASRAKTSFLSRVSHELRTPLNAILGFAQLMAMNGAMGEPHAGWNRQILSSGHQLLHLVDEVLDLSSAESGQIRLDMQAVPLARAVPVAAARLAAMAREAAVQLDVVQPAEGALVAWVDPRRLEQILNNLLSNAIKYNRAGGTVIVRVQPSDDTGVEIVVADSGWGMTPKQLERLFTPFDRLGAERTQVEGAGVGLALTKRLTEIMGGSIAVQSEAGVGSVFTVTLSAPDAGDYSV